MKIFEGKELVTTTDIMNAALQLKEEAKRVSNAREHGAWWDRKVELLNYLNELIGSGGFNDEAYDELWVGKNALYYGENHAGNYVNN